MGDRYWSCGDLDNFLIQDKYVTDTGWRIVSIIPINELAVDELQKIGQLSQLIGLMTFIALSLIGIVIYRSIASPIGKILDFVKQYGEPNTAQRMNNIQLNEIGKLSKFAERDDVNDYTSAAVFLG